MNDLKEMLKIAGALTGVIVGAGFASGQEILQFFTSFGVWGLAGSVISGMLFVFLAMALASLGQQMSSDSHKRVVYAICGKYLGMFVDVLITFFMFAIAVVMLAGAGSLLEQHIGVPAIYGSIAVTILTVVIVCLNVQKVITFISMVTPFLVLMAVIVSIYAYMSRDASYDELETLAATYPRGAGNWLIAALLYVSYNIIAGAPFLVIMGGQTRNRKVAFWGGILGGVTLGILILIIATGMFVRIDDLEGVAMPMLMLATDASPVLGVIMAVVIFGMILNTAVGVLYSFSARLLTPGSNAFRWGTVVAGILAFLGSLVGFITLVGTVYPFFGYLGFVLMVCTLIGWLRLRGSAA